MHHIVWVAISSVLSLAHPLPSSAPHWRMLEEEVQKLPDQDSANLDPDLKAGDILAPLKTCHDQPADMQAIDDLIAIYEQGMAIGEKNGGLARVRYIRHEIEQRHPEIPFQQRMELESGALVKPELTLGALRQASCRALVKMLFNMMGASKDLLRSTIEGQLRASGLAEDGAP